MNNQEIKILLLEDDPNLGTILQDHLIMNGYKVTLAVDGVEGLSAFSQDVYDLCLVDIMMPKMDGFTFVKKIRKTDIEIPIIFLTAKSLKEDKIKGFQIGCDDYITKPFSIEELLLRLTALLKRSTKSQIAPKTIYEIGKYQFDYNRQLLIFKKTTQKLTTRENDLLHILVQNIGNVVEREYALKEIWRDDSFFAGRSMDVFISKLRKYLKQDLSIEIISVHGRGFKLVVSS